MAARAKLNHFKRTAETLSYKLARGIPDLVPEQTFLFIGIKEQIDEIYWLGTTITDTLDSSGGYTTDLQLEVFSQMQTMYLNYLKTNLFPRKIKNGLVLWFIIKKGIRL
ncbi:hypothetical protein MKR64_08930 [Acinetobacter baumannii]